MMNEVRFLQKIGGLLLMLLLFAACSQDESLTTGTLLPEGKYPLKLTAGGLEVAATPAKASTRATVDNDWKDVQSVAVQVDNEGVKEYSVNPSNDNLTSPTPFYWQRSDETKQITAWHPYSATYPTDWKVKADQSQKAGGYQASDLIKGSLSLSFADKDDAEKNKITFAHQTAKLHIVLQAGKGISADELANATVSILNVANVDNGTTVTPCKIDGDFFALITGQEIAKGTQFIKVTVNGADFFYTPDKETSFTDGNQYTYTITVNRIGLSVSVGEIEKWNEGNTGEGSVNLNNEIDLATYTGTTLTVSGITTIKGDGTTAKNLQITVEAGSEVTLDGVVLAPTATGNAVTCQGDATITLKGTNSLSAKSPTYSISIIIGSGIYAESGTLTIEGDGSLSVSRSKEGNGLYGAGIGAGNGANIVINGGTINIEAIAKPGTESGAGIGSLCSKACGNITINGGRITIGEPSLNSACIGSAEYGNCGNITITGENTVISTTKGRIAPCSIGNGGSGSCGTVTIGGGATVNDTKYTETHTGVL